MKIAQGSVEACTATVTWDEIVWVVRKIFGFELSVEEGKKFLAFPNLKLLGVKKAQFSKRRKLWKNIQSSLGMQFTLQ
ncbi:hypothetical protein KEJ24_02015 [Candidatus Bathyarchaeota archaeon]|nr:hypothetical protein [Candidatus Bathyarchaeota archaeon]